MTHTGDFDKGSICDDYQPSGVVGYSYSHLFTFIPAEPMIAVTIIILVVCLSRHSSFWTSSLFSLGPSSDAHPFDHIRHFVPI